MKNSFFLVSLVLLLCANLAIGQDTPPPPLQEIVVPEDTHLAFALSSYISSKTSQPGDKFYGEVIYPIAISNRIVIPAGSYVNGTITEIKRAGRVKGKAELTMRFNNVMLPNGVTKEFSAHLHGIHSPSGNFVRRESEKVQGDSSKGRDAGIIVDSGVQGGLLGAIAGQGKGLAIGGGAGAIAGIAAVLLTRGKDIELDSNTEFDLVLKKGLIFSDKDLDFSNSPPTYQRRPPRPPAPTNNNRPWTRWPRFPFP